MGSVSIRDEIDINIISYKDSFSPYQDEQQPVHFYLSFAPNGLQAWEVERGFLPEDQYQATAREQWQVVYQEVSEVSSTDEQEQRRRILIDEMTAFAHELIVTSNTQGTDLTLNEVELCVEAAFGMDGIVQKVGYQDMEELLRMKGKAKYTFTQSGDDVFIEFTEVRQSKRQPSPERLKGQILWFNPSRKFGRIHDGTEERFFRESFVITDEDKKLIQNGDQYLVEFTPDENDQGPIATGIQIIDEMLTLTPQGFLIKPENLKEAVEANILSILENTSRDRETVYLDGLEKMLSQIFRGKKTLAHRLGVNEMFHFVRNIPDVRIEGNPPASFQTVWLTSEHILGQSGQETLQSLVRLGEPLESNARKARRLVVKWVEDAAIWSEDLPADQVINRLNQTFPGASRLVHRLGYQKMSQFFQSIPEIETYYKGSELYLKRRS